jgi:hypothetical protein
MAVMESKQLVWELSFIFSPSEIEHNHLNNLTRALSKDHPRNVISNFTQWF